MSDEATDLTPDQQLFLLADGALREVVDQFTPATLELAVPAEWSTDKTTSMLGLLANHARGFLMSSRARPWTRWATDGRVTFSAMTPSAGTTP
jgi:hypothetical protein